MRKIAAGVFLTMLSLSPAVAQNIIVVTNGPGSGNPYWSKIEEGAKAAGKKLSVNITLLSAPQSGDAVGQIRILEDQLVKKPDGLVLAPVEPDALKPIVSDYKDAGVPVVFIDSQIPNSGITFVGTDNRAGAKLGGQYLCDHLPKGAKVALLDGIVSSTTGHERAEGATEALKSCGLTIASEQSADWDRAKAVSIMENVITGNPDIAGVFASSDNMALGAVEALKSADLLDKVTVVGFDANPDAVKSIQAGEMKASVAQKPERIGEAGVEAVVDLINKKSVPKVIDTGVSVVTKETAAQ